jgi:predicted lipoprotein with Yx(FWY)xxD motif
MKKFFAALLVLAFAVLAGCASMSTKEPAMMKDGMLVNANCAVKGPPVMATEADKPVGDYSIITRDNGTKQWAYKGKPLYTWPEDQEPGDKYGDNYNKVGHIVK